MIFNSHILYGLGGGNPNSGDGIVDRFACTSGHNDCCEKNMTMRAKHCGTYYVYDLQPSTGCEEAYCFGIVQIDITRVTESLIHFLKPKIFL